MSYLRGDFITNIKRRSVKNLLGILFIVLLATSCSTAKRSSSSASQTVNNSAKRTSREPVFLENISIRQGAQRNEPIRTARSIPATPSGTSLETGNPGTDNSLQFKYAILLDIPVENVTDEKLISFIESWYGTPYRYGGSDHSGIDCSAFVQTFMSAMYLLSVPRTSIEQYQKTKRVSKKELEEGDLVFFRTRGRTVSHVGIYLTNNKFVHASTSGGVMINDLDEDYYARRYAGAGRVRN